jgi:periplasmic divalent cation tolerance protein
MEIAGPALLAISTFPDAEVAQRVSQQLVEERLVACANILPRVQSIYRWKGKLETTEETVVFFKTTRERFSGLRSRLKELHPYDVPELIAFEIADGLPDYLRWISESCESPR